MSKKKKATIFFISFLFVIIFACCFFLVTICNNSSKYLESKYGEHYTITSIKLPYYRNDADFYDLPKLFKRGELIPFRMFYSDGQKTFTVIYKKGIYYDDYQLEDIHKYATEYIKKITGINNIQTILFFPVTEYQCYDDLGTLNGILLKDNKLWTSKNIEELIKIILNEKNGYITIFINDNLKSINQLLEKSTKTKTLLNEYFDDCLLNNDNLFGVCYVNYSLSVTRIKAESLTYAPKFDYYGLKHRQRILTYTDLYISPEKSNHILESNSKLIIRF